MSSICRQGRHGCWVLFIETPLTTQSMAKESASAQTSGLPSHALFPPLSSPAPLWPSFSDDWCLRRGCCHSFACVTNLSTGPTNVCASSGRGTNNPPANLSLFVCRQPCGHLLALLPNLLVPGPSSTVSPTMFVLPFHSPTLQHQWRILARKTTKAKSSKPPLLHPHPPSWPRSSRIPALRLALRLHLGHPAELTQKAG